MKLILQTVLKWFTSFFQFFELQADKAWWIRIKTEDPNYIYYFGPFENRAIAQKKATRLCGRPERRKCSSFQLHCGMVHATTTYHSGRLSTCQLNV